MVASTGFGLLAFACDLLAEGCSTCDPCRCLLLDDVRDWVSSELIVFFFPTAWRRFTLLHWRIELHEFYWFKLFPFGAGLPPSAAYPGLSFFLFQALNDV